MRKNIFVFLWLIGVISQPVSAYNRTEMAEMGVLACVHVAAAFLPDSPEISGTKFGLQFAEGIYNPASEALILGLQHVYFEDKTALGSGLSMANRAMAKNFAGYFNTTETKGYLVAAGVDIAAIFVLEHWDQFDACESIQDWTTPGALVNAFYQNMLVREYTPEMAGLLTSAVTSAVAVMPIHEKFQTTFMAETGFRLVPAMTKMMVSNPEALSLINCLGMFLVIKANRMQPGHLQTFTGATGVSFLIASVCDMIERFKKGITALEG